MGLSASQCRLLVLTARLSDLELEAQQICNAKIRLAMQQTDLALEYTEALKTSAKNTEAVSDDQNREMNILVATYNQKVEMLTAQDKIYDLKLKNIDTEHNACQTEIDSVKKVIDKNIERSFKIFDA